MENLYEKYLNGDDIRNVSKFVVDLTYSYLKIILNSIPNTCNVAVFGDSDENTCSIEVVDKDESIGLSIDINTDSVSAYILDIKGTRSYYPWIEINNLPSVIKEFNNKRLDQYLRDNDGA